MHAGFLNMLLASNLAIEKILEKVHNFSLYHVYTILHYITIYGLYTSLGVKTDQQLQEELVLPPRPNPPCGPWYPRAARWIAPCQQETEPMEYLCRYSGPVHGEHQTSSLFKQWEAVKV